MKALVVCFTTCRSWMQLMQVNIQHTHSFQGHTLSCVPLVTTLGFHISLFSHLYSQLSFYFCNFNFDYNSNFKFIYQAQRTFFGDDKGGAPPAGWPHTTAEAAGGPRSSLTPTRDATTPQLCQEVLQRPDQTRMGVETHTVPCPTVLPLACVSRCRVPLHWRISSS